MLLRFYLEKFINSYFLIFFTVKSMINFKIRLNLNTIYIKNS